MALVDWEWALLPSHQEHEDRQVLLRKVPYEYTSDIESDLFLAHLPAFRKGTALSLNISPGGMLLLMRDAPELDQVLKVEVPTPVQHARTPTLAEVRWTRQIPLTQLEDLHLVGIRFLL